MTDTLHRTMRPAEFRTRLEALGVSREFLADRAGVVRTVVFRNQDEGRKIDVNPRLVSALADLESEFDKAAASMALDAEVADLKTLPRYSDETEWSRSVPELPGWPMTAQPFLLAEVQRRLGGRVGIEYA